MTCSRPSRAGGKTLSSSGRNAVARPSGSGLVSSSSLRPMIRSVPTLEVRMMIVFLKLMCRPSPSFMKPLSKTWKNISWTSGCAFSTSSRSTTE